MPEKDGFEALVELKSESLTKDIPVIILTALSSPEDQEKVKKIGAEHFFIKSDIELSDLTAYLHKLVDTK